MASVTSSRATPADTSATHPYTCNSCQVAFRNSELQRTHMRSDWHRYNLKRRVTSLPPITSEVFTEKVLQAQASSTAAATRAAYERTCGACAKTYFSENAYDNHLGSAKHRSRVAYLEANGQYGDAEAASVISTAMDQESLTTGVESDADDEIRHVSKAIKKTSLSDGQSASAPQQPADAAPTAESEEDSAPVPKLILSRCLFCNYDSPSTDLNVTHMERIHGMFIPERSYLVDLDGLLGSLHQRIYEYHECLFCQKLKPSVYGLQTHMRDKGHCKIPFHTEEEQLEIGEFYDFRSTYSDGEDDDEEDDEEDDEAAQKSGGVKLGAPRKAKADIDDREMEEGDGWETDSSASSVDSEDLTALPLDDHQHQYEKLSKHPHHSPESSKPHRNKDGFHSHAHKHAQAAYYSDYELHLPSGRSVGHRSLAKYYKQNLVNHPSPAERQERFAIEAARGSDDSDDEQDQRVSRRNDRERGRALASRANGGQGMIGVSDQKKKEVAIAEKKSRQVEQRARRRYEWGNNKQANSQKHFRDPLLQ